MQTFIVKGANRPGELANLTGALASEHVNVLITVIGFDGQGVAAFVCNDETAARKALDGAKYEYKLLPTVTVRLRDEVGQAAEISRRLGDQGVNIQCFLPVSVTEDMVIVALGVDNIEAAKKALGDQLVEYTYS
jgi:hypothetical protein